MRIPTTFFALVVSAGAAVTTEPSAEQAAFFESKIRPILAENCYRCHSLEKGKAKGGLTLDSREGWQKGSENGPVIVPGKPEESVLVTAIGYDDPDLQMPPKDEKLSAEQIGALTEWVKMGAPDPRQAPKNAGAKLSGLTDSAKSHWAYQPVIKPQIPTNEGQSWCRTPVDAFILRALEANGMRPNPAATKEALIRRAYYDLVGIPPTPYEVNDFLKDDSPEAFAKVVDHLLASPQYGERWGRFWLDTARYSDTKGGDRNNRETSYRYADAWTYRDYVIRSFNEDKPYNQFALEQIAADLLPGVKENDPSLAALGFLTVGERFRNMNDIINDRIDVVSKGFLGLTVTCARCHDHMFDPIPQSDYYALHGVFASVFEPQKKPILSTNKLDPTDFADFDKKYSALVRTLQNRYYDIVAKDLLDFQAKPEAYFKAAIVVLKTRNKGQAELERNAILRQEKLDKDFVQYLQRAVIRNPTVYGPLAMMARRGSFRLSDLDRLAEMSKRGKGRRMGKARRMMKDGDSMMTMSGGKNIRNDGQRGLNKYIADALRKYPPKSLDEMINLYGEVIRSVAPQEKAMITAMKTARSADVPGFDDDLVDLLRGPFEMVPSPMASKEFIESAQENWPNRMRNRARFNFGELNLLEISHPGSPAKAMVVTDVPKPRNSPLFIRGEAQSEGDIIPRHFLEILSPGHHPEPFKIGSGRLELAQDIASDENPLTARVAVNRIWMHHFGQALVATPDDLGVMAGKPSHPELLDYLSAKFVEFGWSMKMLHKVIMLSAVYQQSTATNADFEVKDPENKLLWRANLRRLDFEAMRDSLLVFSGQLDRTIGGKPVNLTDEPYSYRRSVYGYIDRGNLPELMQHFDFSDPDMPNSKRSTTVVPQQALFLMNSSMAVDVSRKLVARPEIAKSLLNDEKVRWLYRILFQRLPTPNELAMARDFLRQNGDYGGENVDAAPADDQGARAARAKPGKRSERIKNMMMQR
ncbi:MAG: PSD1 and planctomycete cytochrome C domain-containing protein, partial [Chthoniobacteraceae bacterium]